MTDPTSTPQTQNDAYISQRLSYDDHSCTVRYIGPVKNTKGEWLGIEWDDPGRGKHDGEHGGVRYFTCLSNEPSAGSFVRPQRQSDPSRTFLEALGYKYRGDSDRTGEIFKPNVFTPLRPGQQGAGTASGADTKADGKLQYKPIMIGSKLVEQVGFDEVSKRLAQLDKLTTVVLDGFRISKRRIDNTELEMIPTVCPKIRDLNLSKNLWEEWTDIIEVCEKLDNLHTLTVDLNRFRISDKQTYVDAVKAKTPLFSVFGRLKTLSLERTYLSCEDYTVITSPLNCLEYLSLAHNQLSILESSSLNVFLPHSIQSIYLAGNAFKSLDSLRPLTLLSNLTKLDLRHNDISQIYHDWDDEKLRTEHHDNPLIFSKSLSEVNLSHNGIASWSFIDGLPAVFPGLDAINSNGNPLYGSSSTDNGSTGMFISADNTYMLMIAHLSCIATLNYSKISAEDRLNAETFYLSLLGKEISAAPENEESVIVSRHPRWTELCERYSPPVIRRHDESDVNSSSLESQLAQIQVKFAPNIILSKPTTNKNSSPSEFCLRVPLDLSVYTLVALISRKSGLKPGTFTIIWETGELESSQTGQAWQANLLTGAERFGEQKARSKDATRAGGSADDNANNGSDDDAKVSHVPTRFREVLIEPSIKRIEAIIHNLQDGCALRVELKAAV